MNEIGRARSVRDYLSAHLSRNAEIVDNQWGRYSTIHHPHSAENVNDIIGSIGEVKNVRAMLLNVRDSAERWIVPLTSIQTAHSGSLHILTTCRKIHLRRSGQPATTTETHSRPSGPGRDRAGLTLNLNGNTYHRSHT
jgi:hypothetical protein